MAEKIILRMALPTPLRRLFDYLPPQPIDLVNLIPGIRIRVPFQSRTLVGVLVEVVTESAVPVGKLKRALEILDQTSPFTEDIYQLCQWASDYYHYSLGDVLIGALPVALRKGKAIATKAKFKPETDGTDHPRTLNAGQQQAVTAICSHKTQFRVFLLDGVTGSGKTEVYLQTIANILADQKQVLILVPEISLTPQTIARFRARFSVPVVALHSHLSESERLQAWIKARSGVAKMIIGTRSAIFTPFEKLGLIIVDEEHDSSFKQQDRFRYHARDLAIMRASINRIPIVLGSATPSLESLHNAKRKRYDYLVLPERAGMAQLPTQALLDLRQNVCNEGLSNALLQQMKAHLAQDNKVMLFLNRRGFAPVLYCKQCAWIAECKRCDARMVYHRTPPRLHCHHCDSRSPVMTQCKNCHAKALEPIGLGTQRLEGTLSEYFPDIPIIRVDRDNTQRKGALQALLAQINSSKKAILLGTQMLAKGHHFPDVTLVGVVDADSGLFSSDFRATEQLGQLLLQVAGRAGREEKPGTVLIQTHYPNNPLLQTLIRSGYSAFAEMLLAERAAALLPPYAFFAVFRAESFVEQKAVQFLATVKTFGATFTESVTFLGPVPAIITKKKGQYVHHLFIKSASRSALQAVLRAILQQVDHLAKKHPIKWILDVDPIEMS